MKNNFIKVVFISLLCIIVFAGCNVVSSSTPEATPTPTPIEPTPTPIPYGEVLDITVARCSSPLVLDITNISKILLEKFALRVTNYFLATDSDKGDIYIATDGMGDPAEMTGIQLRHDYISRDARKAGGINYLDYLDKLPNYLASFYTKQAFLDIFHAYSSDNIKDNNSTYTLITSVGAPITLGGWMYNPSWFEKYGYDLPRNMEDMVDLLVTHKNTHPDSAMILCSKTGDNNSFNIDNIAEGIFASYGLPYGSAVYKQLVLNESGTYDFVMDDEAIIKALSLVKKIYDNGLLGDEGLAYLELDGENFTVTDIDNLSNYAIMHYGEEYRNYSYYNEHRVSTMEYIPNQLSMVEGEVFLNVVAPQYDGGNMFPTRFTIIDTGRQDVINRLIDFVDWCCTDEGIIACSLGEEGEHYTVNTEGKIEVVKIKSDYEGFDLDLIFTNDDYNRLVLGKYIDDSESIYVKYQNAFKDKDIKTFITYPRNLSSFYKKIDSEESKKIKGTVEEFITGFINGEKTAEDFNSYLNSLENAGLQDFVDGINKNVQEVHEKYKDYLPDSLK